MWKPMEAPPVVQKRKPGRPLGSKNKPKVPPAPGAEPAEPPKKPGRRGRKKKEETEAAAEASAAKSQEPEAAEAPAEEEEPEAAAPALSKEEIKAKVASKKAPSKKKAAVDDKSNGAAAAKKPAKAAAAAAKSDTVSKTDIDAKRKKEIELVVPRKSVKSSDLREATEEATRKQLTGGKSKEKHKDKIEYKVGTMSQFAKKMTRLNANESSKNNDELIEMLTQLFEEKIVYRSDVEHSGLAAIIAILRKATNPTVAQTASAVRRHMMKVLKDDSVVEAPPKKHKAESTPEGDAMPSKKAKTEPTNEAEPMPASPTSAATTPEESEKKAAASTEPAKTEEPAPVAAAESKPDEDTKVKEVEAPGKGTADEPMKPSDAVEKENTPVVSSTGAESPSKDEAALPTETKPIDSTPRPDPSTDKARMNCIDMLGKALEPNGSKNVEIATQIEEQLFDRFKESNAEYISFARKITFTLKRNARIRDRLFNGSLHALELAYASDALLKEM
ncbi:hypothetical protein PINS_up005104 [Pythium insidiosum]|nr:hypothetical protein PINS_up005104 [Pythium insidiosum]